MSASHREESPGSGHLLAEPHEQFQSENITDLNTYFLEFIRNVKTIQSRCYEQVHDAGVQNQTVI